MKSRRLVIIAFMLVAALTLGIGYAAVSGTLTISGRAEFQGTNLVNSDIVSALKFTNAVSSDEDKCTASITGDHGADMTVSFKDGIGTPGAVFSVSATYTVTYETTDEALPDVVLTMPTPAITSAAGSPGWAISTDWTGDKTLSAGQSVDITVTVTYTNQNSAETGMVSATINVPMPWATVATSVDAGQGA